MRDRTENPVGGEGVSRYALCPTGSKGAKACRRTCSDLSEYSARLAMTVLRNVGSFHSVRPADENVYRLYVYELPVDCAPFLLIHVQNLAERRGQIREALQCPYRGTSVGASRDSDGGLHDVRSKSPPSIVRRCPFDHMSD
jgi:hypothetical protein